MLGITETMMTATGEIVIMMRIGIIEEIAMTMKVNMVTMISIIRLQWKRNAHSQRGPYGMRIYLPLSGFC
jgi:hypothetical protein